MTSPPSVILLKKGPPPPPPPSTPRITCREGGVKRGGVGHFIKKMAYPPLLLMGGENGPGPIPLEEEGGMHPRAPICLRQMREGGGTLKLLMITTSKKFTPPSSPPLPSGPTRRVGWMEGGDILRE
nr:hypothetical protein [Morchella crassipes]